MSGDRVPVTLRLPMSLQRRLVKLAAAEGISLNKWMVENLQAATDKQDSASTPMMTRYLEN